MKSQLKVPYHRASIEEAEIDEVVATLRSGWLTTGPKVKAFEERFAAAVGGRHAIAVNSATAAMHVAVEALGLKPGQAVFVPTLTFAATAEVVRYLGAVPVLVDCDPETLCMDPADLAAKLADLHAGRLPAAVDRSLTPAGIIPVYVGGLVPGMRAIRELAEAEGCWIMEDAAHAFPAGSRDSADAPWVRVGQNSSDVACFSFYANKTITTGEGGMAVTDSDALADRMRLMSLHGLSRDAWNRYTGGPWDYRIVAPGFKYNMTDVAAAMGMHQVMRAEAMRARREEIANRYDERLAGVDAIQLPARGKNCLHAWHLYPIRLHLDRMNLTRDEFVRELTSRGVGFAVHWRPLHLHPYYEETFGWRPEHLPVATREWERLVSLPIFDAMRDDELDHVCEAVGQIAGTASTSGTRGRAAAN